jgi:predicted short-subunit dehydrogenase-like oxidoreductase (DUF2520 family)
VLLERAGHRVIAVTGREGSRERASRWLPSAAFLEADDVPGGVRSADLVLLCVRDALVQEWDGLLAAGGAFGPGRTVAHVSGALGLDVLSGAWAQGAAVLCVHPLQSFPDVETGVANLPGSGIAVTAREEDTARSGERIARDLGGVPFRVAEEVKPLYHSAAVFAANYLVTVQATAERLFRLAGIEDPAPLFAPLARANLEAAFRTGPELALTGPAVRGDIGTIRRNAGALSKDAPEALPAYLDLAALAADLAASSGRLREEARHRVLEEIDRWR